MTKYAKNLQEALMQGNCIAVSKWMDAIESAKALLQELRFRAESLDRAIKRTEGMSHV